MKLEQLVSSALDEDLGSGDITTNSCVDLSVLGKGQIIAKQAAVISGQAAVGAVFSEIGHRMEVPVEYCPKVDDGTHVGIGEELGTLEGSLGGILMGERAALNFFMHLSGIATNVAAFLNEAGGPSFQVIDTRKTTPTLRSLEKAAVRHGGGINHRMGLYDRVLIKENHILACGSIGEAIRRCRAQVDGGGKIEIEVKGLDEITLAIHSDADILLLDNMDNDLLREGIQLARSLSDSVLLEASGGMTGERVRSMEGLDLDFVSVGALIHQSTWVDFSLLLQEVVA